VPKPDPLKRPPLRIAQLLDAQIRPVSRADIARVACQSEAMVSFVVAGKRPPNERIRRAASLLLGRPWEELFTPVDTHNDEGGADDE